MAFDQRPFDVRCEWGRPGIDTLREFTDVFVIVDVFSFCTSVDIAVARGAEVLPSTLPVTERSITSLSLSPASLVAIQPGTRLVLPSRNGSMLSTMTGPIPTLAGSLRNARAVGRRAQTIGRRITVVPAGERWPDDTIRFAIEDLIAAGAVISELSGTRSSEANVAVAAYEFARPRLETVLRASASGRELCERGFETDLMLAAQMDCSDCAPLLSNGAYGR
ncbi:MAG TPA: 2-phosphosulfolactate phosphatase [Thermoanaerobaculia bacterium]